ncbi:hypothetical protein HAX54_016374 [Datura stramonium]|uniref:Uncharacterized protein n=1 Tax=Datura stramonium TaxID=4076 RepID=A0ABS8S019_DATST|nr:hypothetical protein [Datura stramonium]
MADPKSKEKQSVKDCDSSLPNPPPPAAAAFIKIGEVIIALNEKSNRKMKESEVIKEGSSKVLGNEK